MSRLSWWLNTWWHQIRGHGIHQNRMHLATGRTVEVYVCSCGKIWE